MPRLIPEHKKRQMRVMLLQGKSLNEISRELALGKSTIYYWCCTLRGRKYHSVKLNPQYTAVEGEIVGIFAGDGSSFHDTNRGYEVRVHFGHTQYILYVKTLYEKYFGKRFTIAEQGPSRRIRATSKEIFSYFRHYLHYASAKHCTVRLKTLQIPGEFKKGFLKGFLDTDGCVSFERGAKRVRVAYFTTSKRLANQLFLMLKDFGLSSGVYTPSKEPHEKVIYRVQLHQRSVIPFLEKIRPYKIRSLQGIPQCSVLYNCLSQ